MSKDLKIIMNSAYTENIEEHKAYQAGADAFLYKPMKLEQIVNLFIKFNIELRISSHRGVEEKGLTHEHSSNSQMVSL